MQKSKWASPEPEPEKQPAPPADPAPAQEPAAAPPPPTTQSAPVESAPAQDEDFQTVPAYDPYMDEFAQTREDDLLFDDDIVPVAASQPVEQPQEPAQPSPEPLVAPTGPAAATRGRGGGRGRGGRRGGAHAIEAENGATAGAEDPSKQPPRKEAAVRGDRSGTGGVKRTKLTEEELAQRMAAIQLKNATLTKAHEKAEADAASFEAREAAAAAKNAEARKRLAERQKQERLNRSQMMVDREKNRQRKLDALKGREWDNEKEDGFGGTGEEKRRGASRGAYGGVVGGVPRGDATVEPIDSQGQQDLGFRGRGRGRGGRGRGGRGSRGGRGDFHGGQHPVEEGAAQQQAIPSASDFPDLPPPSAAPGQPTSAGAPPPLSFPIKSSKAKSSDEQGTEADKNGDGEKPTLKKQDSYVNPFSPADQKRSWADQVEGTMSPT